MVGETLTAVRSHPVMEGNSESGDTVDLRAKMESTDRRESDRQNGVGSPEEGGSCIRKDSSTAIGEIVMPPGAYRLEARGGARFVKLRPPDDSSAA